MSIMISGQPVSARRLTVGIGAVVAIVLALVIIYRMWASTQIQIVKSVNSSPGFSEKAQAMKAQGQPRSAGSGDDVDPRNLGK